MNFLYDDIVHALQHITDSTHASATDRRGYRYVLKRRFTKFSEITQSNGHYSVQGHPRSPSLVPMESSCDFLLVINSNLAPILHRFRDIALDRSTRNSSGDEIANVNFLCDDIVHALKYNRLLHKFRHRSFSATQVYQIRWNNAM